MDRKVESYLKSWLLSPTRKPLVIRGARQVGKTWLVRNFAKTSRKKLLEINFEKQLSGADLFASNDPQQVLLNLGAALNQKIDPNDCLLFLDEIQAVPELFGKLRWFAEDLPQLPVIAAGSLLELVLAQHSFSMPVGRINYLHLEPLSFEEYLLASDKKVLCDYIENFTFDISIPSPIHQQLNSLFKEYILIGGMPAAVLSWVTEKSLQRISQIKNDLLATYKDDFSKYRSRIAPERFEEVLLAIPKMLGQKFVFSHVNNSIQSGTLKQVLNLLEKARLCHRVSASAANGVPLGAEIKVNYFKEIFLDVGLCCTALGMHFNQINSTEDIIMINKGGVAEQVVGQLLRTIEEPYIEPVLFYWHRENSGSNAEVDYVIQHGNKIIPIEIKAGSTGSLKSLHLLMQLKKLTEAVRINSDNPSKVEVDLKDNMGNSVNYTLYSVPFYLTEQILRLL